MSAKKQIAEIVKRDLKEAAFWYENAKKGLGLLFLKEINIKVNQIAKNPLAYQIRYANIRVAFTSTFPYGIHYEYNTQQNIVIILAVFHTAINPNAWNR
jgi:plasmid stabilization system protein ParE